MGGHFLGELTLAEGLGETARGGQCPAEPWAREDHRWGPLRGLPGVGVEMRALWALCSNAFTCSRACLGRKAEISKEEVTEGQA